MIFILGPNLPQGLQEFGMVSFEDTVVAIGGYSDDGFSNILYKLTCKEESCQWMEMSQKLKVGRRNFIAMMVPSQLTNCQKSSK